MKKVLVLYGVVVTGLLILSLSTIHLQGKSMQELKDLRNYYDRAEFLFDEIECDNENYFDGDTGLDYLKARQVILNNYLNKK